jgi:hypothetical protein
MSVYPRRQWQGRQLKRSRAELSLYSAVNIVGRKLLENLGLVLLDLFGHNDHSTRAAPLCVAIEETRDACRARSVAQ